MRGVETLIRRQTIDGSAVSKGEESYEVIVVARSSNPDWYRQVLKALKKEDKENRIILVTDKAAFREAFSFVRQSKGKEEGSLEGAAKPYPFPGLAGRGPDPGPATTAGGPGHALGSEAFPMTGGKKEDTLSFLYRFAREIHSLLDPRRIVDTAVDLLASVLPAEVVTFVFKEADQNYFRIRAGNGFPPFLEGDFQEAIRAHFSPWLNGKKDSFEWVHEGRPANSPRKSPADLLRQSITIPIQGEEGIIALLNLAGFSKGHLEQDGAFLMEQITENLSRALRNALQYQETLVMAETDALTGLPNHRAILNRFREEFERARRYDRPLSVLIVDIDRFKEINDTYGHLIGDRVLRTVADLLRRNLRSCDQVGRYGGDEFMILLPETNMESARSISERIHSHVRAYPWEEACPGLHVSLSIGVAAGDASGPTDIRRLFEAADRALYDAKQQGRDRISFA